MYAFSIFARRAVLAFVLFGVAASPSAAQVQFASTVESSVNASNVAAAVDGNVATAATLAPPVLGGGAEIRVGFATVVQPAVRTGLLLNVGGALSASVFNTLAINTYVGASPVPTQTFPLNTLVTLAVLNTGTAAVEIPATVAFNQVELVTTGVLNVGFTISVFEAFSGTGPLPVELTAFQGKATPTGVLLTWTTASEHNNDRFMVERADEKAERFLPIGQVAGAGTSSTPRQYGFTDATPTGLGYYRLRQVDRDGQQVFSPVIAIQPTLAGLSVYPNPVVGPLTVLGAADHCVGVFDQMGRQVCRATLSAAQQQLDVSRLPNGVYFLRDATTGTTTKFVKGIGLITQ